FAFDTLSYARFLRERGLSQDHAEAHAEAARQFIMAELVTKQDFLALRQDLMSQFDAKLENLSLRFDGKLGQLESKVDSLSLRLTVRLGVLLVAGIGALAALVYGEATIIMTDPARQQGMLAILRALSAHFDHQFDNFSRH